MFYTNKDNDERKHTKAGREGICQTCNSADFCVNLKNNNKPVWNCNEYDDSKPQSEITDDLTFQSEEINQALLEKKEFIGICENCRKRHSCELANSEEGVWRCNEYE